MAASGAGYYEVLVAYEGHTTMSNLASALYKRFCVDAEKHGWECETLHTIHAKLGDNKFTRPHMPGKLQLVPIPKTFAPNKIEIVHSKDRNCDFVQTKHTVWCAETAALSPEAEGDGPASKKPKRPSSTHKVALNTYSDVGGAFRLSEKALALFEEVGRKRRKLLPERELVRSGTIPRDDPLLIAVIQKLGSAASAFRSNIKIIEIPGDVEWELKCDDAIEWIAEKHFEWWPDRARGGA